ncbi:unnamed protein product [Tilletia laevis]|uniref:GATA-type domain-containing protein n=2 Tax=Tilletia TaxID=13289 RepID=A0A177UK61_9BASI|nr:hypothetical protein CF336_g5215 [Tilletia laevis]KAE8258106.1 hypothetical protein A4X03_0g4481 [Tilletia caries]CAD6898666.1 unnamed protein product [Tilletia controversa]KAE8197872.1 hypothetical protein CF335_g4517 [Tilletia laevis]CAD6886747.1 unnamed protein product [Tilletia caries]
MDHGLIGVQQPGGSIDLDPNSDNPSLISEATDAIRLLQDASEREHVLLAFRKAAAEAEARAKTLEEEAREASKRAIEARSAANHLMSIIHQIERGPGAVQQQPHQNDVSRLDPFLASLQPATSSAQGAFSLTSTLGLPDATDVGSQDGAGFFSTGPTASTSGSQILRLPDSTSGSNPLLSSSTIPARPAPPPPSMPTPPPPAPAAGPSAAPASASTSTAAASSSTPTADGRKRPRPANNSLEDRRCDGCGTSDTVLWRHIDQEVFCNACALRRRRATKRVHLEARKMAGAVTASSSGAGGYEGAVADLGIGPTDGLSTTASDADNGGDASL